MWRFQHSLEEQSVPPNVGVWSYLQEKVSVSEALQKTQHVQESVMRMLDASILGNQVEKRNLQVEKKVGKRSTFGQLNIKKNSTWMFYNLSTV